MSLIIRSEHYRDYPAIAAVNQLAFGRGRDGFISEMLFVDSLRHRREYDPELALVAELAGQVVGYALYSPCEVNFRGEPSRAVVLGPLCVHPQFQNQGIGGKLLHAGHQIAQDKGFSLCLLYGEKDYYPRFGYQASAFSGRGFCIDRACLPPTTARVVERAVEPGDIPMLVDIWRKWHQDEPIAMFPGDSFVDWISHAEGIRAVSVLIDGRVVGYLRYRETRPFAPLALFADGEEATVAMLACLQEKSHGFAEQYLHIPSNPDSELMHRLIPCQFISEVRMSVHAMIKVLDQGNAALDAYMRFVSTGGNVAVLNLPAAFEWA